MSETSAAISRRDLLRAAALGGIAWSLGGCGPTPQVSPSEASPTGASPSTLTPPPTSSPTPTAPATPFPSATQAAPLPSRIASLLVVGFRGMTVAGAGPIRGAIERDGLGGVILFDRDQTTGGPRNIRSAAQLRSLTADLRALVPDRRLLIAVDQEGGRVTRLGPSTGFPAVASEAQVGRADDPAMAAAWARGIARTLADVGIDLNLAPVVDLDVNPQNPAIGALGRSFSADPAIVTRLATIEIDAHRKAGVATCLKHFPGLGSATVNTDFGVADVTKTWTRRELEPYRRLIDAGSVDAIMAAHVVDRNLDAKHPASLSRSVVTDLLRGELGWDGVVVTDDLGAAAITSAVGADEAIAHALEAGSDILLFANQQHYDGGLATHVIDVIEGLVTAGRIDEARIDASRGRIARLSGPPS